MRFLYVAFALFVIFASVFGTSYVVNKIKLDEWLKQPKPPGQIKSIAGHSIYIQSYGTGDTTVVILSGLGTSIIESTKLAQEISKFAKVLLIERPGYSWSAPFQPDNFDSYLNLLQQTLKSETQNQKLIFVGFSIGTLFSSFLAEQNQNQTLGVVAVTPLPRLNTSLAKQVPQEYFDIFLDQTATLKRAARAARWGFFRFINMTPYEVPKDIYLDVLNNLASSNTAEAALYEYQAFLKSVDSPIPVPVSVVRQNSKDSLNMLKQYELTDSGALIVDSVWTDAALKYADRSAKGSVMEARRGVFNLHLEHIDDVVEAVQNLRRLTK